MKYVVGVVLILLSVKTFSQKTFKVLSPAGKIEVTVGASDTLYYSVKVNNKELTKPGVIAMLFSAGQSAGVKSKFQSTSQRSVRETIVNPVPIKRKNISDHFNELTLNFKENFSVVFRAYDDGVAYRFVTSFKDSVEVNEEIANFSFAPNSKVYFPQVQKRDSADVYHTSFEEPYKELQLHTIKRSDLAFTPVLIDNGNIKAVVTESDLIDYPGMFLSGDSNGLIGTFAGYPQAEEIKGGEFKQPVVTQRKKYLARTAGKRSYPWRVIAIAEKDGDLLMNDLVFRLASPPARRDWSWVLPGIGTDEWIIGINLRNVDFKAGLNTATYKYYIDFAKRFGFNYVMMDAGWSDNNDLFKITPGIDLEEIAAYAKYKNIGLMLWTLSMTLERQLEPALKRFNELGVKAILTDFMDRDDQKMLRFYTRVAEAAANHKIMVMYHGAFKNAGFERTWPNAITREAILGSEYNIWSDKASPEHDLLIPFIRMVAGPLDYEPGFMQSANQKTFKPLPDHVMSMGTRTHQLAMFVVYDSPLQIFSGNPSDAWLEKDYTTYLASLPTSWDDTFVVDAKLGDYVVIARRKGNDWYVGAMTDWSERDLEIDLSFLGDGTFNGFTCQDGPNAAKNGNDYKMGFQQVTKDKKIKIHLAPGGGFVAKFIKI